MEKYQFITLFLEVCGCGNHCKHCYIPDHSKRFKPLNAVKAIIDNYAEVLKDPALTDNARLYLHDEPTLYPKLIDLWEYGYQKGVKPVPALSTNGFGITKRKEGNEILASFKRHEGRGLNMALYGERDYHDWFAGFKGSYDIRREAARRAKDFGLSVHWNLYLTKDNMVQILRLSDELHDDKQTILSPNFTLKWEQYVEIDLTPKEWARIPVPYQEYTGDHKYPKYAKKSEAEWIRVVLNGEDLTTFTVEDSIPHTWAMDVEYDLFDLELCLPIFKIGRIPEDSLRDIFGNRKHSEGYTDMMSTDLTLLAREAGDPQNERLYHFEAIREKWFLILRHKKDGTSINYPS